MMKTIAVILELAYRKENEDSLLIWPLHEYSLDATKIAVVAGVSKNDHFGKLIQFHSVYSVHVDYQFPKHIADQFEKKNVWRNRNILCQANVSEVALVQCFA